MTDHFDSNVIPTARPVRLVYTDPQVSPRDFIRQRLANYNRYKYSQLPTTTSIRLVSIDKYDPDLSLRLHVFDFSQVPIFRALSYTWENAILEDTSDPYTKEEPVNDFLIKINSKAFQIGGNLHTCLLKLRQEEDIGYIWIDAICINQVDLRERSTQVLMMGDIFSAAERVIVWLGADSSDVQAMLWLQNEVYPIFMQVCEQTDGITMQYADMLDLSAHQWQDKWLAVGRFCRRRRWFRRAWVVQEFALAKEIDLRNGDIVLDWAKIHAMSTEAVASGIGIGIETIDAFSTTRTPSRRGSLMKRDINTQDSAARRIIWYTRFFQIITHLMGFESTREHDKIYAGLGLASKILPPDIPVPIIPNYATEWYQVFTSFTVSILQELPSLDKVLCKTLDIYGRPSNFLPSWCPDYRRSTCVPLTWTLSDNAQCPVFHAAGHSSSNNIIRINARTLTVQGKVLDYVSDMTLPLSDRRGYEDADLNLQEIFDIAARLEPLYTPTRQDRLEVLWRTMIRDVYVERGNAEIYHHPAPDSLADNFFHYILKRLKDRYRDILAKKPMKESELDEFSMEVQVRHILFESSPIRLPSLADITSLARVNTADIATDPESLQKVEKANKFSAEKFGAFNLCRNRRLFRTNDINLFGLGPREMEAGDQVWLIKGASVPYILRPRPGSQFVIIGEAYLHGAMHGEMVEMMGGEGTFAQINIV